jgi:hypothetical protein
MKLGTLARISASPGGERVAKELAKSWGFGEISKLAKLNVESGNDVGHCASALSRSWGYLLPTQCTRNRAIT